MIRRFFHWELAPLVLLIIINLVIGLATLTQFGESWDQISLENYAQQSLDAYRDFFQKDSEPVYDEALRVYGPAYIMFQSMVANNFPLDWDVSDVGHLVNFILFQVGLVAFYMLARRWFSVWAAFSATLLFSTQPLFWGHAFINSKDMPFMTVFLLSLFLGFRMVDKIFGKNLGDSGDFQMLVDSWEKLQREVKRNLILITIFWAILLGFLIFGTHLFNNGIAFVIYRFYETKKSSLLGNLFEFFAEDAFTVGADIYIRKALHFFQQVRFVLLVLNPLPILGYYWKAFGKGFSKIILTILLAGIVLGLATSVRIAAPIVYLLVAISMFGRSGRNAFPILAFYGFVALYILYLTWPYLWPDPFGHLIESIQIMSKYPWRGKVLFDGIYYSSTEIPRTYLPIVLVLQFTEPVLALFLVGFVVLIWFWFKKRQSGELMWLSLVWMILPLVILIAMRSPFYDNSRQIFFLLPPIFLVAGKTLEVLLIYFKRPMFKVLMILGIILPGIIQGIRLHPYSYIYYNSLIGGVRGAYRRFELDYWGTSFRDAAGYVNQNAPLDSKVWVDGPTQVFDRYARSDLEIYSTNEAERADFYDYVVATTRYDLDLKTYPGEEVVHIIDREGAVLAVVKQLKLTHE